MTYFIEEEKKTHNICMYINVEAVETKRMESHYKFTWYPEKKYSFFDENLNIKGEMQAFIKGHQLIREKFYLSNIDGISNIKQVDEHEMIFDLPMKIGISLNIQDLLIKITIDIELYIHGTKICSK